MEDKSLSSASASTGAAGDEPADVLLFMPEATFVEMHGHAIRLGITDSALFTGCWLAVRQRILTAPTSPQLASRSSGAVYFSLASAIRDDALSFAESQDRSMSWAFLKAWDMARTEVLELSSKEQFWTWARHR